VYVSWSSSSTYGGDSGNRIFVLYWRCSLIRVSVIRGSTVPISHSLEDKGEKQVTAIEDKEIVGSLHIIWYHITALSMSGNLG
jgi:hypothetical protein